MKHNTLILTLLLLAMSMLSLSGGAILSAPERSNYPDEQFLVIEADLNEPIESLVIWNYAYSSGEWSMLRAVTYPVPMRVLWEQYTVVQAPGWHCVVVVLGDTVSEPAYMYR